LTSTSAALSAALRLTLQLLWMRPPRWWPITCRRAAVADAAAAAGHAAGG
jgi:hypothetical protein